MKKLIDNKFFTDFSIHVQTPEKKKCLRKADCHSTDQTDLKGTQLSVRKLISQKAIFQTILPYA